MEKTLTIATADISGKRVLMRVDFNVPIVNGKDGGYAVAPKGDQRILATLPSIKALFARGATSVALISHLGRPKGTTRDERALSKEKLGEGEFSLAPVAAALSNSIENPVKFVESTVGADAVKACMEAAAGSVVLLENVRFHPEEEGKGCNEAAITEFRAELSKLGEVYVNDAFGCAHRAHSSMLGQNFEQRAAGLLVQNELAYFNAALETPARPFVVVLGGSKVVDKLKLISNLLPKIDALIIGGGMAFTMLKQKDGMEIGSSLFDPDGAPEVKNILKSAEDQGVTIHLPSDFKCGDHFVADKRSKVAVHSTEEGIPAGWLGMDIGPKSISEFSAVIAGAKTVIWNGPMGVFEQDDFTAGTRELLVALADATANGTTSIIGGGDTATAAISMGFKEKVKHVSTGGGASLELLEGKILPGIDALSKPPASSATTSSCGTGSCCNWQIAAGVAAVAVVAAVAYKRWR
eukprot:TRINITY_DN5108_c0_g1_i1.p1 TRINITY_DN5108_c0_g1~~TRINITY_DN5108_c0_g1_i1.p1  ORF type:complete len:466 (-),score=124.08 TRINITY_DN5108_c0_g1_i1:219-1616(-)